MHTTEVGAGLEASPSQPIEWRDRAGFYIVAYGKRARDCATELIRTLHKYNPGVPVCLVSNEPIKAADVFIDLPQKEPRARSQKIGIYDIAPQEWEYILYLDADTLCCGKLSPMFKVLADGWDMVMTLSPPKRPLVESAQRGKYTEENLFTDKALGGNQWLQWAGGVWGFRRNGKTQRFFEMFQEEWARYAWRDQQAMMRAMWRSPVRIWTYGTEWNLFAHVDPPKNSAGILHFATAAREWGSKNHPGRRLWREWKVKL